LIADNTETEYAMKHNIEQQKIREQRWQRRSELSYFGQKLCGFHALLVKLDQVALREPVSSLLRVIVLHNRE